MYKSLVTATSSSDILHALKIFNIFPLCMLLKGFASDAFRFLSFTHSINPLRAKLCAVVALSALNPFWLRRKYESTFG